MTLLGLNKMDAGPPADAYYRCSCTQPGNKYTKNLRQTIICMTGNQEAQEARELIHLFILLFTSPSYRLFPKNRRCIDGKRG
jgi:hypothetical protein